ncbi:MAG: hypothetical protein ABJK25_04255 [Halieaceae bacterium]
MALVVCGNPAFSEGSRTLYPADYDSAGSRAALDLQSSQMYLNRVKREGFHYVYAEAGEYITVASSNRNNNGDIQIFNPQPLGFGTPGDETIPASASFSCSGGSLEAGLHYSGSGRGYINNRTNELAGPRALMTNTGAGYSACGYQAPTTGIYGVRFGRANTGGGPDGTLGLSPSNQTAEAWDITIRSDDTSTVDINGRVFSYAFLGYTGGNSRPVFHSLYYITTDGYRYRQDLRGLDPNGYALYANTFGFLDDNQPLYKTIRGDSFNINVVPLQVTTQAAQYPIFYSDVMDPFIEPEVEKILDELSIPLSPPSPTISNVSFSGVISGSTTAKGVGGEFTFDTTGTVSYEIVISRDGVNFDAAETTNRVLNGIAYAGSHVAIWDGLDNDLNAFPAGTYSFSAAGRAGEVHFPIIDAENNDDSDSNGQVGGGPTIERLNGVSPGDRTVFFDDRGYITTSGEAIGILNGDLCGGTGANPADPPEALAGVDSLTPYRLWEGGRNANSDCSSNAGWGDAKAVNLWTYFLSTPEAESLSIIDSSIDLATSVVVPDSVTAGDTVQGTVSFSNFGNTAATNVSYMLSLNPGLGTVTIPSANLPTGWTATYNNVNGVVTITPSLADQNLAAGASYSGITFSYTAPASGPVNVTSEISSADTDDVPSNNISMGSTAVGDVDVRSSITGVPALVEPGSNVTGAVVFSSVGIGDADGVTYGMQIGSGGEYPASVTFTNLPGGASANYTAADGSVTFSGLPDTFLSGDTLSLNFEFTTRIAEGVSYPISSVITTTDNDANPSNDTDAATVATGYNSASIVVNATPSCQNDVPYLLYDITAVGFTPNTSATVEFLEVGSGTVVETLTNQPLVDGKILWPGAAIDGSGNGTAWPGWVFSAGAWSQVPSSVRPNVQVRFSVNPSETVLVSYPPATPGCVAEAPPGTLVDLSTTITANDAMVLPGGGTGGTVTFANNGPTTAFNTNYSLTIGSAGTVPSNVMFTGLPVGASATIDTNTGVVTFIGMPDELKNGDAFNFSYTYVAPLTEGVSIQVSSAIDSSVAESDASNNMAADSTEVAFTPGASISIDAQSVCDMNAPYVEYDVTAIGFTPNTLATVQFIDANGATVQTLTNQPLTGGRLLWPGAAIDGSGEGSAWPGWSFSGGVWSQVPSLVRPELDVEISVNPTDRVTLSYPPATPDCDANPPPAREVDAQVILSGFPVQAGSGEVVSGVVTFSNNGPNAAEGTTYMLTIGAPGNLPDDVTFTSLPAGVVASFDDTTGTVTFTGMPTDLPIGTSLEVGLSYTLPADVAEITVAGSIDTTNPDSNLANNNDSAATAEISITIDASAVCDRNAPYVEYEVTALGFTPASLATVEFIDANGTVVQSLTDQPLTGGRLLWPDAAIDGSGEGSAWPGWVLSAGVWSQVPSLVRPDLDVEISVNPSDRVTLSYPPATPDCDASPPTAREVDAVATVSGFPATADGGDLVSGTVTFGNNGPNGGLGASYLLSVGEPGSAPSDVDFTTLPSGVSASYDAATGVVTLSGMPTALESGDTLTIDISYTMPEDSGNIAILASVSTTNPDSDNTNNSASTLVASGPEAAPPAPTQPVPVPGVPLPQLLLLILLVATGGMRFSAKARRT